MSRVFIVGAGFSLDAGMPSTVELAQKVAETLRNEYDHPGWRSAMNGLRGLIELGNRLADGHDSIDPNVPRFGIEELAEYIRLTADFLRASHHQSSYGRSAGDTRYREAGDLLAIVEKIEEITNHILLKRHEPIIENINEPLLKYEDFFNCLDPYKDAIVSFNYDLIIEMAAAHFTVPLCISPRSNDGPVLTLHKLHGSLDWFLASRQGWAPNPNYNFEVLHEKKDIAFDSDTEPNKEEQEWPENRLKLIRCCDPEPVVRLTDEHPHWLLTGLDRARLKLGHTKSLESIVGLGAIWEKALRSISQADEIVIIGFSFAPVDRHLTLPFYVNANNADNQSDGKRVLIVDPVFDPEQTDEMSTKQRLSRIWRLKELFPTAQQVRVHPVGHREVNWKDPWTGSEKIDKFLPECFRSSR